MYANENEYENETENELSCKNAENDRTVCVFIRNIQFDANITAEIVIDRPERAVNAQYPIFIVFERVSSIYKLCLDSGGILIICNFVA